MKNAVYFQSGGPTAVINSSFYGVIKGCKENDEIGELYGSLYGITGLMEQHLVKIDHSLAYYQELIHMNGAILGTARKRIKNLEDESLSKILACIQKYNIGYIFVNGGNDSMDTADKLNQFFESIHYDCIVIGIPKTIDNDLVNIDHCPGFGSACKYITRSVMEIGLDIQSYQPGRVTICEIMGRDAGWLAASSACASLFNLGPDLIYLPEHPFSIKEFYEDVTRIFKEKGHVLVCVSEALKDKNGQYISVQETLDSFGHQQLGSVGKTLEQLVSKNLHIKTRSIELSLMQRSASHLMSKVDQEEAIEVGVKAVQYALEKKPGMVSISRVSNSPYQVEYPLTSLKEVANGIKLVPSVYMNTRGNGMNRNYLDYVRPFIDEKEIEIQSSHLFIK